MINSLEKSRESFFSADLPDEEVHEYTDQLCSESYLAFLNMLYPRIKLNYHTKIPMLVIGAQGDTIFHEDEVKAAADKYQADLIMFEDIAHDMMLDINQERVSKEIIDWIESDTDMTRSHKVQFP
jgi:alpha-beta hydrolase superfamily lysophospholipase